MLKLLFHSLKETWFESSQLPKSSLTWVLFTRLYLQIPSLFPYCLSLNQYNEHDSKAVACIKDISLYSSWSKLSWNKIVLFFFFYLQHDWSVWIRSIRYFIHIYIGQITCSQIPIYKLQFVCLHTVIYHHYKVVMVINILSLYN